jgi:hypothetical protein
VQIGSDPRYVLDECEDAFRRRDLLRVLMAGGEAERVVFGREPIGSGSDDQRIATLLTDDDEGALRAEVARLLGLNRGTLRFLAARLMRAGMMDGAELERVVRGC